MSTCNFKFVVEASISKSDACPRSSRVLFITSLQGPTYAYFIICESRIEPRAVHCAATRSGAHQFSALPNRPLTWREALSELRWVILISRMQVVHSFWKDWIDRWDIPNTAIFTNFDVFNLHCWLIGNGRIRGSLYYSLIESTCQLEIKVSMRSVRCSGHPKIAEPAASCGTISLLPFFLSLKHLIRLESSPSKAGAVAWVWHLLLTPSHDSSIHPTYDTMISLALLAFAISSCIV